MSRVIFKMKFKHPNLSKTTSQNISHVQYIATRSGVDKTLTESDLKKELEKGIEDLAANNEGYAKYINERPRSHGLFGQEGIEDPKEVQQEIAQVSSFVWRGIVSIKEDDAKNLGYLEKDKWQDMLRKRVPDMANEIGIRFTNLRWVGAVHMEKGHPHAHIMLWEKQPERTIGVINTKALNNIRKIFTDEIFEEERFQLLNEKNIMRELITDLAKGDISQVSKLLKEVRISGLELRSFISSLNSEGVVPRLYSEEEIAIADKIKELAGKLPGKGRVALKFMSQEVKEEVRAIADYLLKQPEMGASLEKNLKAVEELTRMYTDKEDAINKARDNAYRDIRDRVSQVILKGAVESQRNNVFYVDKELANKAVNFIKTTNNKINFLPEQMKVITELSAIMMKIGQTDEQIKKHIKDYVEKESLNISEKNIGNAIKESKDAVLLNKNISNLSSKKDIDSYLATLRIMGFSEAEAFKLLRNSIIDDNKELHSHLQQLKDDGYFKISEGAFELSNKGITEFLKVKALDSVEKEILKMIDAGKEDVQNIGFNDLIENKNIFTNLHDTDPKEFQIGKFDTKVRDMFGENNSLTLKELEEKTYEKYTNNELSGNTDIAEKEIDILKSRIEKLALNGYIELNKESGSYSFTDKSLGYFEFNKDSESYVLTKDAVKEFKISEQMEFTKYDAEFLVPEREILRKKIDYLERLGFVSKADEGYQTTNKYYQYMKDVSLSKDENSVRTSKIFNKEIIDIVEQTYNKVDVEKIKRANLKIAMGKEINNEYNDIKIDYETTRAVYGVSDTLRNTVTRMSTTLLVSGVSLEETKDIMQRWIDKIDIKVDVEKLNKLIDNAHKIVSDNNLWGKTTLISINQWKSMFESIGVPEKDMPKWMYKGENWKAPNITLSIVNDIWKSAWQQLERQRMQTEAQAELAKRNINQQQAVNRSKEAIIEEVRKNKDKGSIEIEDVREM